MPRVQKETPNLLLVAVVAGHMDVVACFLDVARGLCPLERKSSPAPLSRVSGGAAVGVADKRMTSHASKQLRAMVDIVTIGLALDLAVSNGHTEITALLLDFNQEQWGGTNQRVRFVVVRVSPYLVCPHARTHTHA
jgi:hypothetical protein